MIWKSRKFWLMVSDVVISTATYFITNHLAPEMAKEILWVIAAWQPVIVSLITGIALEDAGAKASGRFGSDF